MRHNKSVNHLGRKYAHREAMLSNMACSLIMHKRIFTTVPKAKELRKYVEPIITKCKTDTTHSRRLAFKELRNKYAVTELFQEVSRKVGDRPGGYTRIIKTGNRLGDNASMCFIELVDYNELMLKEKAGAVKAAAKTRRSRRGGSKSTAVETPEKPMKAKVAAPAEEKPELPVVEEKIETLVEETPVAELPAVEETPVAEVPATEEAPVEEVKTEATAPAEEAPESEEKPEEKPE